MRLLLTGGTGFFGRSLLQWFANARNPTPVTILTRSPQAFLERHPQWASCHWLQLHEGDVTRMDTLAGLAAPDRFTHVLHAATDSTDVAGCTSYGRMDQIMLGTRNMLEFSVRTGVQRFLLTSSGAVYGPQPPEMAEIAEDYRGAPDPLLPGSTYGLAKRMAEHLCALATREHGLHTVVARCFAFVGEDLPQNAHFAIGNFIRDALHREAIEVAGDGSPVRSYLYQADLAQWLTVLLAQGRSGEAYNVGSDQAVSIAELAHLVRDLIAPAKPVRILGKPASDNPARNLYVPCIAKARDELGLEVRVSLAQAIRLTAERTRVRLA